MGVFVTGSGYTENPAFKAPPSNPPNFGSARVRRGFMYDIVDQKYKLNFLFNPATIDVNYEFTEEEMPADYLSAAAQKATNYVTGATCSFQLLFDRTEDYIFTRQGGQSEPKTGNQGVLMDVGVFENLVGITEGGIITTTPVRILFGTADRGGATNVVNGSGHQFKFDGTLINSAVTFTFFAYDMMPTRCVIACTFRRRITRDDMSASSSAIGDLFGSAVGGVGNAVGGLFGGPPAFGGVF